MSATTITGLAARRVWDSRGHPTVEVEVTLAGGATGRAAAPAGASRGRAEAVERRDGGTRLGGRDVQGALAAIRDEIAPALNGMDAADQRGVDGALIALDGTARKARLGGNAIVATSLAVAVAAARASDLPLFLHVAALAGTAPALPLPEIQIFGGGAHAAGRVSVQDFLVMVPGAASLDEAFEVTAEIYHAAGALMARRGRLAGVADEGGWWPDFRATEEALDTLAEAIEAAGEHPGERVVMALDIAASEFHEDGRYTLDGATLTPAAMAARVGTWLDGWPIASIEDPMAETDAEGMRALTAAEGGRVQIVGDDYLVTDAARVRAAAAGGACNAVLVKPNQAGSLTEAIDAVAAAREAGFGAILSARSGETEDVWLTHLATGLGAGQIKVGSFARSERMAKWNEALRVAGDARAGGFVAGRPLAGTWWGRRHARESE